MGYFKEIELETIEMFRDDGMKEIEIAKSLGISLQRVHSILAKYESDEYDRDPDMVRYDDLVFEPNDANYNAERF
jgi:DNA invertase Pin-like site-specific DNA recombinase